MMDGEGIVGRRAWLQRSTACALVLSVLGGVLPTAARAQAPAGNPGPGAPPPDAPGATASGPTPSPGATSADPTVEGPAPMLIPEVNVQATAWRAWQPVSGYVAPVTTTGSKTDTPIIEAPQSLGVVTRDQIDDQQAQTVSQALRYTAGVLPEVRPSNRYDSVFVRGFGGQGSGAAFVNFLDGLRQQRGISYNTPAVDPWLLERIEVLRGPASVLYGQTGAGGLVNLVSRRPTAEPIHEVRLEAGNYDRVQTLFDFGGRLTEDGTFTYRLTGAARRADTQYDSVSESRIAIAPAVTWRPDAGTTLTILTNFQRDPEGGFYNFVPALGTVIPSTRGRLRSGFFGGDPAFDTFERNQASVGYQFERRLDDVWTVRQNFRYSYIDSTFQALSIRSINGSGIAGRTVTDARDFANTFALDNQAQASFSTGPFRHTVLFGLDWARVSAKRKLGNGTDSNFDIFAPTYYRRIVAPTIGAAQTTYQNQDQLGLYAQDQVAFGRFRFNLGVRHDWATSETVSSRVTSAHTSQDDGETTWRTGLLYLFDSGIAPYASYSTSFLPNAGTTAPARGTRPFNATTGEQYEAGIKYQPPGFNSYVQAAAFHIRQDNVLTPDPLYNTFNVETGRIRSRGVELEGRASLSDNLDLIATYTFIDADVTRSSTAAVQGKRVPQVPHNIASGWANYRFTEGALRGLELGGGVRYVGSTYGNDTNTFKVGDVTLFDAAIRYDVGAAIPQAKGLELTLNANNLSDKSYISSCSSETGCYFGNRLLVLGGVRVKW